MIRFKHSFRRRFYSKWLTNKKHHKQFVIEQTIDSPSHCKALWECATSKVCKLRTKCAYKCMCVWVYLSGLSEAHTESIIPTSNVPYKKTQTSFLNVILRDFCKFVCVFVCNIYHSILRICLFIMHLSNFLFCRHMHLTQHAEPMTAHNTEIHLKTSVEQFYTFMK